jgi:hypothetical protein
MPNAAILTQETPGRNNADLRASAHRVVQSGQYKKQRVISIIPAIAPIPVKVYLSHCCLIAPPNQGFVRMAANGMEVGAAYSDCLEQILANPQLREFEYLLTIEADNCPPSDGLLKLIKRMEENKWLSAVSGLYWCKGESSTAPHIWGDVKDPVLNYRPQPPIPGELVECYGLSMGFTLYRMAMFRDEQMQIEKPFFETKASSEGVGTQDLSFWGKARKHGYRCAVDCGVLVGHWDEQNQVMW